MALLPKVMRFVFAGAAPAGELDELREVFISTRAQVP
jgi:hypothetical protein